MDASTAPQAQPEIPPDLAGLLDAQEGIKGCHDLILEGRFQGKRSLSVQRCLAFLKANAEMIGRQVESHPTYQAMLAAAPHVEPAPREEVLDDAPALPPAGPERLRALGLR